MAEQLLTGQRGDLVQRTVTPVLSAFRKRSLASWMVVTLVVVLCIFGLGLFFEAVAPVSDFWFQPGVTADSGTYWLLSGVRGVAELNDTSGSDAPKYGGGGSLGPVLQAKIVRTDIGVLLSNCALVGLMLWLITTMPEFDLSTFLLLLVLNPMLFSVVATLNKEVYSAVGLILFLRYMTAKRFRWLLLLLSFGISFGGHWQQGLVLLMLAALESRFSPFRRKYAAGLAAVIALFTIGYTIVYHIAPVLIAGLLAQAQAGNLIVKLDNIQGNFGFPLVLIPKIMMNVMGHLSTPWYFLNDYWHANFDNWFDQFFTEAHELLTTVLLMWLFLRKKLPLKQPLVYLLAVYFVLTAVNPMVQPRYEYAAYVLMCLQASRYYPLGLRRSRERSIPKHDPPQAVVPSLT